MISNSIDYKVYALMDLWNLYTGVYLLAGWDPDATYYDFSPGYSEFKTILKSATASINAGNLRQKNSPTVFCNWAISKGFKIPKPLAKAVEAYSKPIINWEKRCQELEVENLVLKDENIALKETLENSFQLLEKNDPFYSSELNTAIVLQGTIKKKFTAHFPTTSEMIEIVNREFASAKLRRGASNRIATVVNPDANKNGGRSPPSLPIKN